MDLLASFSLSGSQLGTAQNLTMAILLGAFIALSLLSLFLFRSGHERAHRLQVLREKRREELQHQRPKILEALHEQPRIEEGVPQ